MDANHAAHDLFLLMLNLAQLDGPDRIKSHFIEALNTFWPEVTFRFIEAAELCNEDIVEVATRNIHFGCIQIARGQAALDAQTRALIHNAACMLALLLENQRQAQCLAEENVRLDATVQARTADLVNVNEQLLQAQKMHAVGTLAGGIAHDFNNILSIILGNAELAADQVRAGTPIWGNLDEIQTACLRAREMVRQLLSFSRKSNHVRQPIQLAAIVTETISLIRSSIPAAIEIRARIEPAPCAILGNATEIHQILLNLCANAAQAMRDKAGLLEVCLSQTQLDRKGSGRFFGLMPGKYAKLEVSDTGGGIPADHLDRIFEPYFTTKAVGEGTGLGLSVVHGIVKSHRGVISVESEPGRGTCITLLFPCCQAQVAAFEPKPAPLPGGTERVMLVDDESALIKAAGEILERLGYRVELYDDPRQALRQFHLQPDHYDLIITDVTMPHIAGDQLIAEIRKTRPGLPVILSTGFAEKMNRERALQIGACNYLEKPIKRAELAEVVRRALDGL